MSNITNFTFDNFNPLSCRFTGPVYNDNNNPNIGQITDESDHKVYTTRGQVWDRLVFLGTFLLNSIINTVITAVAWFFTIKTIIMETLHLCTGKQYSLEILGTSILRLFILLPIGTVALEIVSIFGLFFPNNAKKLYTNVEKLVFGFQAISNAFHPVAEPHADNEH